MITIPDQSSAGVIWSVLAVLAGVLFLVALVVWARSKDRSIVSLGWFVVMVAIPILGPAGYLVDSRRRARLAASGDEAEDSDYVGSAGTARSTTHDGERR